MVIRNCMEGLQAHVEGAFQRNVAGVAADEEEKSGRGYSNCMGDDSRSHSVVCVVALYNVFKTRLPT